MDTSRTGSSPTGSPIQQSEDQSKLQTPQSDNPLKTEQTSAPTQNTRDFNPALLESSRTGSSPTGDDSLLGNQRSEEHPDEVVKSKNFDPARTDYWTHATSGDIIEVDYTDLDQHASIDDFVKNSNLPVHTTKLVSDTHSFRSTPRTKQSIEFQDQMRRLREQKRAEVRSVNDPVIEHWHDFLNRYPTKNLTYQGSERNTSSLDNPYAETQTPTVPVDKIRKNTDCVYNELQQKNPNVQKMLNAIAELAILDSVYGKKVYSSNDLVTSNIITADFPSLDSSAQTAVSSRLSSVEFQALVELIGNYSIKIGANLENPHDLVLKMKKLLKQFQNTADTQGIQHKIKHPGKKDYKRAGNELNKFFKNYGENFVRRAGKLTEDSFKEVSDGNSSPIELINLFKQVRSEESNLSKDFENELLKSKFVLEYPDGNRQWLTDFQNFGSNDPQAQQKQKQNCIEKLNVFCNLQPQNFPKVNDLGNIYQRNNLSPVELISYLANSKGMKMDDSVRGFLHTQNALPLPLKAKTTSDTGETDTVQSITGKSDDLYIIKANEDGSFKVTLHSLSPISHCSSVNSNIRTDLSPLFSHWNTTTEVSLSATADGTPPVLENFMFDYAAVSSHDNDNANENQVLKTDQLTVTQSKEFWDAKLAIPMLPETPPNMDINFAEAKSLATNSFESFMMNNSNTFKELRDNINTNKNNFSAQEIEELNNIVHQLEKSAAIIRISGSDFDALTHLSQLSGNYVHLQNILSRSVEIANDWTIVTNTANEDLHKELLQNRLTTCHALSQLAATLIGRSEDAVCDFRAAADDQRISDDHEISKIENASLQTAAVVQTLTEIYDECVQKEKNAKRNDPTSKSDYHSKDIKIILTQMTEHAGKINVNLAEVRENHVKPMIFGTGIPDKKFKKSEKAILTGLLREKKNVPWEHSTYSQAQLASLRIKRAIRQKPHLKATLRNFDKKYARNFVTTLENQNWAPIVNNFNDINYRTKKGVAGLFNTPVNFAINEYKMLKSIVTPAPSIQGEFNFTEKYGGIGMPSCNRIQAKHMNNLSHSQLSNRQDGKVMFAGLRHGFIDAYDIRPEAMSTVTDEEKQALLDNVGNADLDLQSFRNTRGIANVRASANEKVATELVAAAVIADPVLLQNAKDGKPVRLNLDSVLLGSPDVTAFPRNSGKADHRLQANQRAALARLGNKVTIPMKFSLGGGAFEEREVNVDLTVRSYTFPFSRHALSKNWLVKLFVRPFLGLRRADRLNEQAFSELLGPLDQDYIGGDAAAMTAHLIRLQKPIVQTAATVPQNDLAKNPDQTQKLLDNFSFINDDPHFDKNFADNIEARLQNMPFESRDDLAEAILTLARDTKRILRERMHHSTVADPCILAARVSMLSYLLGRTPAYSCKNGMYRTGMLDTSIKLLATDTAAKRFPAPESSTGERRYAMYALSTGNLRLQEYNTGRRGYNPKKFPWQLNNVRSAFARNLLVDESKSR